jgi:Zn-dependent peptidase ImmA (M78 family)
MIFAALTKPSAHPVGAGPDETIARLASRFNVSSQAMEYRLANLGLIVPPQ